MVSLKSVVRIDLTTTRNVESEVGFAPEHLILPLKVSMALAQVRRSRFIDKKNKILLCQWGERSDPWVPNV